MSASFKPSPLSLNSPRSSPFRRPSSPSAAQPPALLQTSSNGNGSNGNSYHTGSNGSSTQAGSPTPPTTVPGYPSTRPLTPSKLAQSSTPVGDITFSPRASTARNGTSSNAGSPTRDATSPPVLSPPSTIGGRLGDRDGSPTRGRETTPRAMRSTDTGFNKDKISSSYSNDNIVSSSLSPSGFSPRAPTHKPYSASSTPKAGVGSPSGAERGSDAAGLDALARLPPAQVRELREAFQILDRDSDGFIDESDVAETLSSVGLDSGSAACHAFFTSLPCPLPLAPYLGHLSSQLARLAQPAELLAALAAFDEDDSGQVDTRALTEALIELPPLNNAGATSSRSLSRADVASAMEGFVGKRAFGGGAGRPGSRGGAGGANGMTSGYGGSVSAGDGRGEVFRYREWVASLGAVSNSGAPANGTVGGGNGGSTGGMTGQVSVCT